MMKKIARGNIEAEALMKYMIDGLPENAQDYIVRSKKTDGIQGEAESIRSNSEEEYWGREREITCRRR